MILLVVEHDRGELAPATLEGLTAARALAAETGLEVEALVLGDEAPDDELVEQLGAYGAQTIHQVEHDLLGDYGPEVWGEALAQAMDELTPEFVLATGTDRGNEVVAQAAARRGLPMVANCIEIRPGDPAEVTRVRWGGSLLEVATLDAEPALITIAHHSIEASPADDPAAPETEDLEVDLDEVLGRSLIVNRVEREAGITLSTAPVVVGGGRGVGSPDGFGPLEELAKLLGGAVGCSRAVTNNGWRNHADQVGQTGTRIAPEIYLACGISGAIQHWVGAMASKTILAINTDAEANMVAKADYAVIADLHEVIPAVAAEIQRRRG